MPDQELEQLRAQVTELKSQLTDTKRYYRMFELSLPMAAIASFEGYFVEVNPSWTRALGWSAEELKAKPSIEFVHPEDRESTLAEAWALTNVKTNTVAFKNRYAHKNGGYRTLCWSTASDHEAGLMYAVAQDVTTMDDTVARLERSEQRLRQSGRIAQLGGWELDIGTQQLSWDEEVFRIHELTPGPHPSLESAVEFYAPEARPKIAAAVECCMKTGLRYDLELPFVTATGKNIWVRAIGERQTVPGTDGRLHGVFQDITERMRIQRTLEKGEQALRRLHQITSDTRLDMTSKMERLLALGLDTLDLRIGLISHIEDDAYTVAYALSRDTPIASGTRFELANTYCAHVVKSNGPQAFHHVEKSEIRTHPCYRIFGLEAYIGTPVFVDGARWGTLNFSSSTPREPFQEHDIDLIQLYAQWVGHEISRDRAHRALRAAKEQAEVAVDTQARFLATMSHEIRTPMNGVLGMTQLLSGTPLTAEQLDYVQTIESSSGVLLTLLNDILDISKLESGKVTLEADIIEPRVMAKQVTTLFRPVMQNKGVALRVSVPEDVPEYVVGDGTRIRQILSNLISNAAKFTDKGTITLSVTRQLVSEGSAQLRFAVHDTGIGLSPAQLEKLFEPFTQADSSTTRKYGGTGLGLSICRRLTSLMGGEITVESAENQGSTFAFWLPLPAVCPLRSSPTPQPPPITEGRAHAQGLRVLLAEDNLVNRKVATLMLRKLDCQVTTAEDGLSAVRLFGQGDYDLVLMDCQMPGLDGLDATRRIRQVERARGLPRTRVVALTANVSAEDQRACYDAGMDDFLAKPIVGDSLVRIIDALPTPLAKC